MLLGEHFPPCFHSACAHLACLQGGSAGGCGKCSLASTFHRVFTVLALTWHASRVALHEAMENARWRALSIVFSRCLRSPGMSPGWLCRRLWKMLLGEHFPSCFHGACAHLACHQSGSAGGCRKMLLGEHFPSCFHGACAHLACLQSGSAGGYRECSLASTFHRVFTVLALTWHASRVALQEGMENVSPEQDLLCFNGWCVLQSGSAGGYGKCLS